MKAKAARELVRLHGDDWESWAFSPAPGGLPRRTAANESSSTMERVLAVPARHVVALPLWVVIGKDGKVVHYRTGLYQVDVNRGLKELDAVVAEALKKP